MSNTFLDLKMTDTCYTVFLDSDYNSSGTVSTLKTRLLPNSSLFSGLVAVSIEKVFIKGNTKTTADTLDGFYIRCNDLTQPFSQSGRTSNNPDNTIYFAPITSAVSNHNIVYENSSFSENVKFASFNGGSTITVELCDATGALIPASYYTKWNIAIRIYALKHSTPAGNSSAFI